ncbi:WecB/TagA/CpsF family glycosyltransferase [Devosia sp.]|uniref:WecB/TagA/CpsF family glycosyltransferase n=1 Tax=Devosia sp. TaxID=1871048 RepID=UPI001AC4EE45|nr:WecB/TagA/CpsF family glycosyltransferase [Devosia sp.]MBN9309603.1 WecB/TagA/CpsF family glycosyltransferase [Devosia sp.]
MAIDRLKDLTDGRHQAGATLRIAGVPVSVVDLEGAVERILGWARHPRGRYVCVRDLHGLVLALEDRQMMRIHEEADMVTPDGMPLVWLGRACGLQMGRACGADLMARVVARSADAGVSQFFLGGRPGVGVRLGEKFTAMYPHLQIAGSHELPFAPIEDYDLEAIVEHVNASGAGVVWVGLSTPRQELLMHRIARRTRATFIGVGAAFDFHSGDVKRAPRWMQRVGLEWVYRVLQDPERLGPRYVLLIVKLIRYSWRR